MKFAAISILIPIFLLTASGCGKDQGYTGPYFPVKGKITTSDGKPVPSGKMNFAPSKGNDYKGPNPQAVIKDGFYTVMTGEMEGAPPGAFKVMIDTVHPGMSPEEEKKAVKLLSDYSNPERTLIGIHVKESPGPGDYDIKVQLAK